MKHEWYEWVWLIHMALYDQPITHTGSIRPPKEMWLASTECLNRQTFHFCQQLLNKHYHLWIRKQITGRICTLHMFVCIYRYNICIVACVSLYWAECGIKQRLYSVCTVVRISRVSSVRFDSSKYFSVSSFHIISSWGLKLSKWKSTVSKCNLKCT